MLSIFASIILAIAAIRNDFDAAAPRNLLVTSSFDDVLDAALNNPRKLLALAGEPLSDK